MLNCHDGKHRTDDGAVPSRDCSLCHLLIERAGETGSGRPDRAVFHVMNYSHPVDIGDSWKQMCVMNAMAQASDETSKAVRSSLSARSEADASRSCLRCSRWPVL